MQSKRDSGESPPRSSTSTSTSTKTTSATSAISATSYDDLHDRNIMLAEAVPTQVAKEHTDLVLYLFRVPGSKDLCLSFAKPAEDQVTHLDIFLAFYYVRIGVDGTMLLLRRGQPVARIEGWLVEVLGWSNSKNCSATAEDGKSSFSRIVGKGAKGNTEFTTPWGGYCEFTNASSRLGSIKCNSLMRNSKSIPISELKLKLRSQLLEKGRRAAAKSRHSMMLAKPFSSPTHSPKAKSMHNRNESVTSNDGSDYFSSTTNPTSCDAKLDPANATFRTSPSVIDYTQGNPDPSRISTTLKYENRSFEFHDGNDLLSGVPYPPDINRLVAPPPNETKHPIHRSPERTILNPNHENSQSFASPGQSMPGSQENFKPPQLPPRRPQFTLEKDSAYSMDRAGTKAAISLQKAPQLPPRRPQSVPTNNFASNYNNHPSATATTISPSPYLLPPLPLPTIPQNPPIKRKPLSEPISAQPPTLAQPIKPPNIPQNNPSPTTTTSPPPTTTNNNQPKHPQPLQESLDDGGGVSGKRGKKTKLAKLIIHGDGQYMLDLVVAANLVLFLERGGGEV